MVHQTQRGKIKAIAPGRFELPSPAPKASMIDHYTTGLQMSDVIFP